MWSLRSRFLRRAITLLSLAVLTLSCGCRTGMPSPLFTASGPGWRVQEGQALWRPRSGLPELGGELVLASDDAGRSLVEFTKTPLPMVTAQITPTNWMICFPANRMGFSGKRTPPAWFTWLQLPAALSGKPLPSPFRFQQKADGGWRLENLRSGETIEGFLAP